jgi:hypothetical protein
VLYDVDHERDQCCAFVFIFTCMNTAMRAVSVKSPAAAAAGQVVAVRCWRVVRAASLSLEVTDMQVGRVVGGVGWGEVRKCTRAYHLLMLRGERRTDTASH